MELVYGVFSDVCVWVCVLDVFVVVDGEWVVGGVYVDG